MKKNNKPVLIVDAGNAERSHFPLPAILPERENPLRYSKAERIKKIAYFKKRSNVYLRLFNNPNPVMIKGYWNGDTGAAREYYQEKCEYYTVKAIVWEIAG